MLEEVNYSNGQIMEALNNKADLDLNNLSVDDKMALIEEHKETIMGWMMPDYSKGVSLNANTPAPSNGVIFINSYVSENYRSINIDSVMVFQAGGSYNCRDSNIIPICKGSSCNYASTFFPYKGAI